MEADVKTIVLLASVLAFPDYDIDQFCAKGVAEQVEGADQQLGALAMCKSLSGMSRAMAEELWRVADPARQASCDLDAAGNYARLHQCLAKPSGKGDRLK